MKSILLMPTLWVLSLCLFLSDLAAKDKEPTPSYDSISETQDALRESIKRGAQVYEDFCIQCHLGQGEGVPGTFPPLAHSNWLTPERYQEAIHVVKYGQQGKIEVNGETYDGMMANLGLYDDEVADVMNYIMNNWGNTQEQMVTEAQVQAIKE